MLMTLTTETNFWLLSYNDKVIDTINFLKFFFLNFITDTQSWLLKLLCHKTYQNLYFMVMYKFKRIVGYPYLSDTFKKDD